MLRWTPLACMAYVAWTEVRPVLHAVPPQSRSAKQSHSDLAQLRVQGTPGSQALMLCKAQRRGCLISVPSPTEAIASGHRLLAVGSAC